LLLFFQFSVCRSLIVYCDTTVSLCSYDHRRIYVERDLKSPVRPPAWTSTVSFEFRSHCLLLVQYPVWYWKLQRQRLYNISDQPVPIVSQPYRKEVLMFKWNFLCFNLCPLVLILNLWEDSVSVFCMSSFLLFVHMNKLFLNFLFSSPSSSYQRFSSSFIIFVIFHWTLFSMSELPRTGPKTSDVARSE